MEGKKLTDEEIVKALENCIDDEMGCVGCPYHGNSCRQMDIDTLDLIRRLQNENERLNDMKFTQEHCDLYKENEWLKAELKRELAEHEEFTKKAKAEIERLTEELNLALDIKETISGIGAKTTELLSENENLLKENAELQKQVDELKIKTCPNADYCGGRIQQAVKDTAKKILGFVRISFFRVDVENWIKEHYGVEVE